MNIKERSYNTARIGPVGEKILLLLMAGATLALTSRPDVSMRVLRTVPKAWKEINRRALRNSVQRLYRADLVQSIEHANGTLALTLTTEGERRASGYRLRDIIIKKPEQWDGLWRLVMFDIPEKKRKGRNALAAKLKELGFHSFQKSAFIFPYACKDEIDFIVELFELRHYVRVLTVKEIDIDMHLKKKFGLR